MKPYADAGLMDLAKSAGYHAETLTPLRTDEPIYSFYSALKHFIISSYLCLRATP